MEPTLELVGPGSAALEYADEAGAAPHRIHRLLLSEPGLPPQPTVLVLDVVHVNPPG